MFAFLNHLSVRNRIWAIVAIFIGSIALGSTLDILMLRDTLKSEKELKTRELVENSFSVLVHYRDLQRKGELSEEAAKAAAIGTIKAMRHDGHEYFWLNDLGTPFPRMIMNPLVPALDGKVMDAEQFNCATSMRVGDGGAYVATDGRKNLFAAFVEVVQQGGQGYVTYDWPKPAADGKATEQLYPKLSYVKKFEPWGWVIGSGIYIDDIDRAVQAQALHHLLLVLVISATSLLLAAVMARSITRPLRMVMDAMHAIGEGRAHRLPVEQGSSEIDRLAANFNEMLDCLQARDAELARHQEFLEAEVSRRTVELRETNLKLEAELVERKQAEQALHDSDLRFRSISGTAQDAIIMLDGDCHISYWNAAAEKIFGYSAEDVMGQELHALLAPERFQDAFRRGFDHFKQTGEGVALGKTMELAARRKDGSEFPMELSVSAFQLQDTWLAVGFVRDISERKVAEHEMREGRARMRALLDASDESVLLLETEGRILAINAFGAGRFGMVPEQMTGMNFFDLLPPELAAARRAAVLQAASSGEPIHHQDRRGAIFFDNSIYPVKGESGAVESVAVYAKDVTEQHRAKQVDDIFSRLDMVLLKWRMNMESVAQMFCDDVLPVFNLAAAWIGRAEKDGRLVMVAGAEAGGDGFLEHLATAAVRWDGAPSCCLPIGAAIRSGLPQRAALDEPACRSCSAAASAHGDGDILLLPLTLRGDTWGVLALYGRNRHQFDTDSRLPVRLAAIAGRLGVSLESALQQEWLTLLDAALAGVGNAVLITDEDGNILWANRSFAQLSGYATEEILGRTPRIFSSGVQDAEFYRHFWQTIRAGRTWHGDIVNARRDGSRYTASQTVTPLLGAGGEVTHYVAIVEDITDRKAMEERIQHTANYDLLTDLPNRGLFFDRLGQALALALRDGQAGALLFLDLDRFKEVNDRFGHAAGDKLLIAVADCLRQQVRASDTVARLAGDEFTVLLPHLGGRDDAVHVAEKILAAISQPMDIEGNTLTIGVSIGIALFPEHGENVEQILNAADHAMYQAKQAGRNTIRMSATVVA